MDDGTYQYLYGTGGIGQVGSSETHYYLFDGLGSTMALVDATGAIANTYDYDVRGGVRASTGTQPNEFQFTGEQVDPSTNLEYLRARYYDNGTGRFLATDTVPPTWTQPATINRFPYVGNNPVNFSDPSGLCPSCVCLVPFVGCEDPVGTAVDKVKEFSSDPFNQANAIQGAGYIGLFNCPDPVCKALSIGLIFAAYDLKSDVLCDSVANGELSSEETSALLISSSVPKPVLGHPVTDFVVQNVAKVVVKAALIEGDADLFSQCIEE